MSRSHVLAATVALSAALFLNTSAPQPHRNFDATLWVQRASEWRALCQQAYNTADAALPQRLADSFQTAAVEQREDKERSTKWPAIIVDIDETVLDNSPYQARLILDGETYNEKSWKVWVEQADAQPLPGALEFLQNAARRGAEIFYVTNRTADLEDATRQNLKALGFPLNDTLDTVLMKGERDGWTSDKGSRRQLIAERYRIVMLIGDDFGDFCSEARQGSTERTAALKKHTARWGRDWFVLPNPTYGSWQKEVVGFRSGLSSEKKNAMELRALDPRR